MTRSPSLTVGTRPFGFSARYSGSLLPPKGPPKSTRSYSSPSSAQHHSTFCTLDDVVRPQIFSIRASPIGFGLWSLSFFRSATAWRESRRIIAAGGVDEPICFPARRCVSPVAAQRGGDPTRSVSVEKLEDGGQLREAGADRVSGFQRRLERQARRQAERVLERQRPPPARAARAAPVPIIVGRDNRITALSRCGPLPSLPPSAAKQARSG